MEAARSLVGPNYLRTMRIPLAAGRDLSPRDTADSQRVAIVSQAFAERYWPGQDALGRRVQVGKAWCTIVGVARNARWEEIAGPVRPFVYLPVLQNYYPAVTVYIRVAADPMRLLPAVEKTIHGMNPHVPLFDASTLKKRTEAATFLARIASIMVGVFGLVALLLAVIGIYGVVSCSAGQRTQEIGIRTALGARPWVIIGLFLRQGIGMATVGVLLGGLGALMVARLLRNQLIGVEPADPMTLAVVGAVMTAVTLFACYIPARRVSRIDPLLALRR